MAGGPWSEVFTVGFRMDSRSSRKVGREDGQSKEETDGIFAYYTP
jgi:hypothetical protein